MTDEEIISIVLDICIYKGDNDGLSKKEYQAIQGLVDLYNKEKEKNEAYKELLKHNEFRRKIETCMTHNMPENAEIICMIREDFERNFGNDYISKDKIREILKDIDENRPVIAHCKLKKLLEK